MTLRVKAGFVAWAAGIVCSAAVAVLFIHTAGPGRYQYGIVGVALSIFTAIEIHGIVKELRRQCN